MISMHHQCGHSGQSESETVTHTITADTAGVPALGEDSTIDPAKTITSADQIQVHINGVSSC